MAISYLIIIPLVPVGFKMCFVLAAITMSKSSLPRLSQPIRSLGCTNIIDKLFYFMLEIENYIIGQNY